MTNEWGASLTGEEMKALKGRIDPETMVRGQYGRLDLFHMTRFAAHRKYSLPANHPYYKVREYNQKHGTNLVLHYGFKAEHPKDYETYGMVLYSGSSLLCDSGKSCLNDFNQKNGIHIIAYTPKPKESEVKIEADTIDLSKVKPFDRITPERRAELREQGSLPGSGLSPCEEMPSDEAIEVALKDMKYGGVPLEKVKAEPNEHYEVLVVARLIQQYEPDRLKPAVDVAAEEWATSEGMFNPDHYQCFKAGAAWQKENGK